MTACAAPAANPRPPAARIPSNDDTDSPALILYETYLNGVLVPDGGVGGTNTIAYCRDVGLTTVVLRAVDASGNRSGPSNELNIIC